MGSLLLLVAGVLMLHAGICYERQKKAELTKAGLRVTASVEVIASAYFAIAAIGHYAA